MPHINVNDTKNPEQRVVLKWSKPYTDPKGFEQDGYVQVIAESGVALDEKGCQRLAKGLGIAFRQAYPRFRIN